MFIQTESTPNPATLKFLPGQMVLQTGTADFPSSEAATSSPMAQRIFAVDGVTGVFFGPDFVTVTKSEAIEWDHIKPGILGAIMEHYQSGDSVMEGDTGAVGHAEHFERGVVYLHMQGACAGCPSSTMTLKMGIENLLKHYIPEVTEVRPVAA